jgi:hypothetical protein
LKVDFQGSRVTSDGGLILARELDERLGFGDLKTMGSGSPGDEFSGATEGLLAARMIAWRKNVLVYTRVGVYFQPLEGQNINSG